MTRAGGWKKRLPVNDLEDLTQRVDLVVLRRACALVIRVISITTRHLLTVNVRRGFHHMQSAAVPVIWQRLAGGSRNYVQTYS